MPNQNNSISSHREADRIGTASETAVPTVDLGEVGRFIDALTGEPNAPVTFQLFQENGGAARILHGTLHEHAKVLTELNRHGACVCVTVNKTDLRGRKAENITDIRAVFVDCDRPDTDPFGRLAKAVLPPHIVVESSPGKAHAYWRVIDCPLSEFSAVQAALIHQYAADAACKDLPRPMRVPGFIHWKGAPYLSRIKGIGYHSPYSIEQIKTQLCGHQPTARVVTNAAQPRGGVIADPERSPLDLGDVLNGVPEGTRDTSIFRLACSLRAQDFAFEEARDLVLRAAAQCTPPFLAGDAMQKLEQAWKYPAGTSVEKLTDVGNAKRLVAQHGSSIRWIVEFRKWLMWKGDHWELDIPDEIMESAKATASRIYAEAARVSDVAFAKRIAAHAARTQQLQRLRAMMELAKTEPGISIGQHLLDADPWLLGVRNGVLNLRSGILRAGNAEEFITKRVAVAFDPTAQCPVWLQFLDKIMRGDRELIAFLQRAVGYSLSGLTAEQCLFFLFGMGRNGKSTFLRTMQEILGEYAAQCSPDTLMTKSRDGGANNDIARLRGARFVSTIEAEEGKRFAEALIKQMTGEDTLVARFLFQEHFEYRPQFKIWLAANHKPIIRGDDFAIWRRIKLIPFTVTIPEEEVDRTLADKLAAERAGILRWAVDGCLSWQREGLNPPSTVTQATEVYRSEMDVFGAWLNESCECRPALEESSKALYGSYRQWCDETESYTLSRMKFSLKLKERGFHSEHTRNGTVYHGVALRGGVT
jgi:putative DNA primase/helicase